MTIRLGFAFAGIIEKFLIGVSLFQNFCPKGASSSNVVERELIQCVEIMHHVIRFWSKLEEQKEQQMLKNRSCGQ